MPSFGEELRQAREAKGISLRQISDDTHIGIRFLQAIESDNYSLLPGGIFTRSFVRSYARYIGLDEEQALARYNQQLEEQGGEPPRTPAARYEGIEEEEPSSWGSISLIVLILIILGVGGYGAYRYFKGGAAKANESNQGRVAPTQPPASAPAPSPEATQVANALPSATPTAAPTVTPTATPTPTPAPVATAPATAPAADALRIKLEAHDQACWISVKPDGATKAERLMLQPGQVREYVASEKIVLNLGNLTSLSVTLNGRPAKLGPKGATTASVVITKENYQQFIE